MTDVIYTIGGNADDLDRAMDGIESRQGRLLEGFKRLAAAARTVKLPPESGRPPSGVPSPTDVDAARRAREASAIARAERDAANARKAATQAETAEVQRNTAAKRDAITASRQREAAARAETAEIRKGIVGDQASAAALRTQAAASRAARDAANARKAAAQADTAEINKETAGLRQAAAASNARRAAVQADTAEIRKETEASRAAKAAADARTAGIRTEKAEIDRSAAASRARAAALRAEETATNIAERAERRRAQALRETADRFKGVGTAFTAGVTVPIVAAGGAAVKVAADLEQSIANISTIKPEIDTSLLTEQLEELSTRVPKKAEELAASVYNIFSSIDVSQTEAVRLVEQFAKGATAAQTDVDTFGTAVIGVMNAYKLSVDDAGHVSDVFFNTVNRGVVNGQELASNLGVVTQAAKNAGVGLDELGGFIAGVTKEGGSASQNINNLANLFQKLPTKEAQAALAGLGIAGRDAAGNFRPTLDVLEELRAKLSTLSEGQRAEALQALFPDAQARTGLQTILSQLDFVRETIDLNAKSAGSTEVAYAKMAKTASTQFALLQNVAIVALGTIGRELLPLIIPAVEFLTAAIVSLVAYFKQLPGPVKVAIGVLAAIAAAIGPALLAIAGLVALKAGILAVWAAISAGVSFLAPVIPLILAIGAAVAATAVLIYANWDRIRAGFTALVDFLRSYWEANGARLLATAQEVWQGILAVVLPIVQAISGFVEEQFGTILTFVEQNWPLIQRVIANQIEGARLAVVAALTAIQQFWAAWGPTILSIVRPIWELVRGVSSVALNALLAIVKVVLGLIAGDWRAVWSGIGEFFGGILGSMQGIARSGLTLLRNIVVAAIKLIGEAAVAAFQLVFLRFPQLTVEIGKRIGDAIRNWRSEIVGPAIAAGASLFAGFQQGFQAAARGASLAGAADAGAVGIATGSATRATVATGGAALGATSGGGRSGAGAGSGGGAAATKAANEMAQAQAAAAAEVQRLERAVEDLGLTTTAIAERDLPKWNAAMAEYRLAVSAVEHQQAALNAAAADTPADILLEERERLDRLRNSADEARRNVVALYGELADPPRTGPGADLDRKFLAIDLEAERAKADAAVQFAKAGAAEIARVQAAIDAKATADRKAALDDYAAAVRAQQEKIAAGEASLAATRKRLHEDVEDALAGENAGALALLRLERERLAFRAQIVEVYGKEKTALTDVLELNFRMLQVAKFILQTNQQTLAALAEIDQQQRAGAGPGTLPDGVKPPEFDPNKVNVPAPPPPDAPKITRSFGEIISAALAATNAVESFGAGFSQAFASAVLDGENFAKAMGALMLKLIGELCIAWGQYHLAQGIANSLNPLAPGSGAGQIAGGLALLALGGALVAASSAISSSGNSGGGAAAGPSGGGAPSSSNNVSSFEEGRRRRLQRTEFNTSGESTERRPFGFLGATSSNRDDERIALDITLAADDGTVIKKIRADARRGRVAAQIKRRAS